MSNLKVSTLAGLTGASVPIADVVNGTARAWVNFNGTGTVAIRASYNVSSITDNGTGIYTINFTTALSDANYSVVAFSATQLGGAAFVSGIASSPPAVSSVGIYCVNNNTGADLGIVCVSVFR